MGPYMGAAQEGLWCLLLEIPESSPAPRHGDLRKCIINPEGGPNQKLDRLNKWAQLTNLLNDESLGDSRSEEKWRKVWSDLKNNTKRKWVKLRSPDVCTIYQMDPPSFTDLEIRVLTMMGVLGTANEPNTQIDVTEDNNTSSISNMRIEVKTDPRDPSVFQVIQVHAITDNDSSRPGCSTTPSDTTQRSRPESPEPIHSPAKSQTPPSSPSPSPQPEVPASPPPRKKRRGPSIVNYLLRSERRTREDARERERLFAELERERIRQRDVELRQRDTELLLQGQWLEFMKSGLNVLEKYLDKK